MLFRSPVLTRKFFALCCGVQLPRSPLKPLAQDLARRKAVWAQPPSYCECKRPTSPPCEFAHAKPGLPVPAFAGAGRQRLRTNSDLEFGFRHRWPRDFGPAPETGGGHGRLGAAGVSGGGGSPRPVRSSSTPSSLAVASALRWSHVDPERFRGQRSRVCSGS